MVTWFDADDVTRFRLQKIVEGGGIGTQAVFEDNNWQMWVILSKAFQPTPGSIFLTIFFNVTVLLDDRLWSQWNHFL